MDVKKISKKNIADTAMVSIKYCGNVIEVQHMEKFNNKCNIKLIDKDHFIRLNENTGEVYECNHIKNRSENLQSLKITMKKLRELINCNTVNINHCRWVTITYAENMQDTKKLYTDIEKLVKRVQYKFGKFEYIHVAEPQGRGAWHLHCIWIFDKKAPYISQKWLSECWGLGKNVTVKKLDDKCDNLGAYLTAYLCDVEFDVACNSGLVHNGDKLMVKDVVVEDDKGNKQTKKFIKGARLCLYPPKMNLFRCSRGVKRPVKEYDNYKSAKEKISSAKLTYSESILISDELGFENIITKEYYNILR